MAAAREEDHERASRARQEFFGVVAEYTSKVFDSAAAYNQIIIVGGYAAFFTIWSSFAKDIDRSAMLVSGTLMILSLVVYISWTALGMYQLATRNMEATASFEGGVDGFIERIQAVEISAKTRAAKLQRHWRKVLWSSGSTGFVAALTLAGSAIWTIIPHDLIPRDVAVKRAEAAAAKAECNARVSEAYSLSRGGPGATAYNKATKQRYVLLQGNWVVIPRC